MTNAIKPLLFAVLVLSVTSLSSCEKDDSKPNVTAVDDAESRKKIEQIFEDYEKALKAANAENCTNLYTSDGVFMPSAGPTARGAAAIRGSYEYVFSLITPDIQFKNIKIEIFGSYAVATSNSEGTSKVIATGEDIPEINRELFSFKIENGEWKIAKYMFNKSE